MCIPCCVVPCFIIAYLEQNQDVNVEGLEVMKVLMERRKVEIKEEEEEAEAKQKTDRDVSPRSGILFSKLRHRM